MQDCAENAGLFCMNLHRYSARSSMMYFDADTACVNLSVLDLGALCTTSFHKKRQVGLRLGLGLGLG